MHDICEQYLTPEKRHDTNKQRPGTLDAYLWGRMQLGAAAAVCWPEPVGSAKNSGWGESRPSCSSPELVSLVGVAACCGGKPEKWQWQWDITHWNSSQCSDTLCKLLIFSIHLKTLWKNVKHNYTIKMNVNHVVEKTCMVLEYKYEWNNVSNQNV